MGEVERDPRWEWIHVPTYDNPDQWIRGRCRHLEVVPVESVAGDLVAQLCLTCDRQLDSPVVTTVGEGPDAATARLYERGWRRQAGRWTPPSIEWPQLLRSSRGA